MEREKSIRRVIGDPGTTIDQMSQAAIDMFKGLHGRVRTISAPKLSGHPESRNVKQPHFG